MITSNNSKSQEAESVKERYSIKGRIKLGMSESERYELLKNRKLSVVHYDEEKLSGVEISDYENLDKANSTVAFKILKKIGEQFGIFKDYENEDVEIEFEFSRGKLKESVFKQDGEYQNYAKMLTVFDEVVENAIGIEAHKERYANKQTPLRQIYVFNSAFATQNGIVPTLLEVKEFNEDRKNSLHIAVSLAEIEKSKIIAHADTVSGESYTLPALDIKLSELFKNVNTKDGRLLKYIPDGFLDEPQKEVKAKVLQEQEDYVAKKNLKYSIKDSTGRKLTNQQAEYFKDSKVRDEDGNLLVMYHGTPNAGFTVFRSGTYFTENKKYAENYTAQGASILGYKKTANNPDTYAVYLNITKPLIQETSMNNPGNQKQTKTSCRSEADQANTAIANKLLAKIDSYDKKTGGNFATSGEGVSRVYNVLSTLGESGKSALAEFYDGESDFDNFYAGFSRLYEAGVTGIDLDKVNTYYAKYVSPGAQQAAHSAGLNDAKASLDKEVKTSADATIFGNGKGGIATEGKQADFVKASVEIGKIRQSIVNALDRLGKKFGVKISLVDHIGEGKNGFYDSGEITIALDSSDPFMTVASHEVTHHMQKASPKEYRAYRDYAISFFASRDGGSPSSIVQKKIQMYSDYGVHLTEEGAMDEIAAEFAESLFSDEFLLKEFIEKADKSIVKRFFEAIKSFLKKISGLDRVERERLAQREYGATVSELERAVELWEASAKATQKIAQEKGDVIGADGGDKTQFSARKLENSAVTKAEQEYNRRGWAVQSQILTRREYARFEK